MGTSHSATVFFFFFLDRNHSLSDLKDRLGTGNEWETRSRKNPHFTVTFVDKGGDRPQELIDETYPTSKTLIKENIYRLLCSMYR